MNKSSFHHDLSKEEVLSTYLDVFYKDVFNSSEYSIERISDLNLQHKGVDLILSNKSKQYNIDEKAQLDYINSSLPTFAFELSYLKNGNWKKGWLFDTSKTTDVYFLITNIHTNESKNLDSGLSKIKITGIYREKLIDFLAKKGLTENFLYLLEKEIRENGTHGKIVLKELNPKTEGILYFSKDNKYEKPINLVLKLNCLIQNKTGKIIFKL
jgi:hypothetical protein